MMDDCGRTLYLLKNESFYGRTVICTVADFCVGVELSLTTTAVDPLAVLTPVMRSVAAAESGLRNLARARASGLAAMT